MSKKPTSSVYYVKPSAGDGEDRWIEIGAAWTNQDRQGMSIQLDALPLDFNGRLVIRKRKEKAE